MGTPGKLGPGSAVTSRHATQRLGVCVQPKTPLCFSFEPEPRELPAAALSETVVQNAIAAEFTSSFAKRGKKAASQPTVLETGAGSGPGFGLLRRAGDAERPEPVQGVLRVPLGAARAPRGGPRVLFRAGGPAAGFSFCSLSPPCHLSRQNRLSRSVVGRALACSAPFGRARPGCLRSAALGPGRIGPAAWQGGRPTRGGQWGVREVKRRLIRPFSISLCFPVTPALSALTPARVPWPVAQGRGSRARPRAVPSGRDSAAGPAWPRGSSARGGQDPRPTRVLAWEGEGCRVAQLGTL